MTIEESKKLSEIAKKLGTTVSTLLESKTPEQVIREYNQGSLSILND